jgi:hypothetical protein
MLPPMLTSLQICQNPACSRSMRFSGLLGRGRTSVILNGRWFCSSPCCITFLIQLLRTGLPGHGKSPAYRHRIPLGLWLLSREWITARQLQEALQRQRLEDGKLLGQCLEEMGAVNEMEITTATAAQWVCPVLASTPSEPKDDPGIPYELLLHYQMVPVHWNPHQRLLHIGFCKAVDYLALTAIENVLDCRAQACFLPATWIRSALTSQLDRKGEGTASFAPGLKTEGMLQTLLSYVRESGAEEIRIGTTPRYVWARLQAHQSINLLFQRSEFETEQ